MIGKALVLAALLKASTATVPLYGQCGGTSYTGDTTCAAGSVCVYSNPYYSQCLAGTTTGTSTTTTTTSTTTSSAKTTSVSSTKSTTAVTTTPTSTKTTTTSAATSTSTGFVKTSGQSFTLGGNVFTVVGENAYWLAQLGSTTDIDQAFADIAGMGGTTVRTWGFNEVTAVQSYGAYYQLWTNGVPAVNYGANGLGMFDEVVASAKSHGIKLIVTLTNNWSDYGGMDVYVQQILGSANHDYFYSNAQVIAAFEKYVAAFVGRYVNEPTILGWELANEPRCAGSTGTTSGTCTSTTISTWVQTISSYIKSIDSNHLVGLGDEGFGMPVRTDYVYSYGIGTNFTADLQISSIDFGTFHLYPGSWGETADPVGFGNNWITDHVAVQKSLNKPVILEEFGVIGNQSSTYATWLNTAGTSGLTGWLIWQAGSQLSSGPTSQDGYAIYPTDPTYQLLASEAADFKARNAGSAFTTVPVPAPTST